MRNIAFQNKPEHKQIQWTQSWYEPALRSLESFLEIRKANLRKIKRDENQAAITRNEFIEVLMNEHRLTVYQASQIVASLQRANKILMYGSFIYEMPEVGEL
ncbi:hypothetical protein QR665_17195 [Acinetobacter gerneri]|uniref:hypothetical protein n=1 Tax=Acinetobacter gerneri TaxID=202952 RepID=UPI0029360472|nr:hypothetical protein [Acinetobacter gerneri]MDV2441183.1 hypothetical protein [Acinetobacter gerneri]